MQRQRGELVPIGDAVSGLDDGPVTAIRDASPPARRGFTLADQVHQLVTASEADADLGFMARLLALCSLPRTNPGNRKEYIRRNGPFTLAMTAGVNNKLPYGNFPRLILAWVCSEAVKTQSRVLILGASLADFMKTLGVYSSGGGREHTKLRNQMRRLFNAYVQLIYEDKLGEASVNAVIARRTEFWWNERKPDQPMLWKSKIELSEDFFKVHPVNGEVPPVKGRPWKLPHYANRGKTSSSRGELASARSCFSTVRTALGKLRITGLLARFDVARSFPQFPRPLLLQPTIWTSERGADLGSGRCQPRPHLPIYRMTLF